LNDQIAKLATEKNQEAEQLKRETHAKMDKAEAEQKKKSAHLL